MSHIHLPDGVLPVWLWLGGYVLVVAIAAILWRRHDTMTGAKRYALLGIFAALMILVMSIEIPLLPYHANLSVVTAIILGPALAILVGFVTNLFLAFVGHGGITVVGLNTLVLAVEMLVGYGMFLALTRARAPLAVAAFLAVVIGLAAGTAASFGVIVAGAPAMTQVAHADEHADHEHNDAHDADAEHAVAHDEHGHEDEHGHGHGHGHAHGPLAEATEGGQLNLGRLAALMFGLGSIGWVVEGILSAAIVVVLSRVFPHLRQGA